MKIPRPEKTEYAEAYDRYVQRVPDGDLTEMMKTQNLNSRELILNLSDAKLSYRYAPGKWSIKEIIQHLIDAERIFSYRALRFARKDKTPLPGFEENDYAPASQADRRAITELMDEFGAVREASIRLFRSFDAPMFGATGVASGNPITVRALAYIIPGHELHHMAVIRERYLK